MSTGTVSLVIAGRADLKQPRAEILATSRAMGVLNAEAARMAAITAQGRLVPADTFRNFNQGVAKMRGDLMRATQASGQYYTATRTITSETTKFNEALGRQKVGLGDVWGQMGKVRAAMREQMELNRLMVRSFRRDATGRIDADILVPKIDPRNLENMRKQLGYMGQVVSSVSNQMVNWGKNTQWTGRQLTVGFSVPISIAAGFMARFALEADASMTRIAKVYGDSEAVFSATTESIRNMATDTATHIAKEFGIAAEETRSVMAELAATGLEGPELQGMTYQTQRLSLLGEMTPDESLKLMRTLKEVYGFGSAELEKQVNYFNAIENATALTLADITEGIPRIAGVMKATGTSLEEQTELLVAFKSAGIDIAEGANALKSINFKAIAATPTAANNFFRITGVHMDELVKRHEGQFVPMMMEISELMEDMSQPDKVDLIARVFGIHQGSRAITLIEQLRKGSESMRRAQEIGLKSEAELARTTQKEIEEVQQAISTQFAAAVESIKVAAGELGMPIVEMITPIINGISGIIEWVNALDERAKKGLVLGAAFLAASGPLVMFAGLMLNLVGMTGRVLGGLIKLIVPFEILNAESKAAQAIQALMANDMTRNTDATTQLREAVEGLAASYGRLADSAEAAAGATTMQAGDTTVGDKTVVVGDQEVIPVEETRRGKREAMERSTKQWMRLSGAISGASMAALTFGSITNNSTLQTLGGVGLAISGLLPMFAQLSKVGSKVMLSISKHAARDASQFGAAFRAGTGIASKAMSGLMDFMKGPFGLATAAVIAGIIWAWNRHRKQIQEIKDTYTDMANTAKSLGDAYGFLPQTAMQRSMDDPTYDPNTIYAQKQRTEELKQSNEELYEQIIKYSERIEKTTSESARQQELLNEAVAQGAMVLRNTGDPEKAKMVAWDVYNIMSDEFMSYDDFVIGARLNVTGTEFTDDQVMRTQILSRVQDAADYSAARLKETMANAVSEGIAEGLGGRHRRRNLALPHDTTAQIQQQVQQTWEAAWAIPDVRARFAALQDAFGEETQKLNELYNRGLEEGWVKAGTSMAKFVDDIEYYWGRAEKYVSAPLRRKDGNIGFADVTRDEAAALAEMGKALGGIDPKALEQVRSYANVTSVWSGRTGEIHSYIDALDMAIAKDALFDAQQRGDAEEVKRHQAEINRLVAEGTAEFNKSLDERATERVIANTMRAADTSMGLGFALDEAAEDADGYVDSMDDAAEATKQLSRQQQRNVKAFRNTMTYAQNYAVDYYRDEFAKMQDAERAAKQAGWDQEKQAIDDRYDSEEKRLSDRHELEKEQLSERHEIQQKNLRAQSEAAMDALGDRQEAAMEAFDEETERIKEARDLEKEAHKEAQEEAKKQLNELFDARVAVVQAQIDEEERLEKLRQRMYENERTRISRLQELYSDNIDINMAINTGDLDEAARISSAIGAKQSDWAVQDLSQISSDASKSRVDVLNEEIDAINDRRDLELEALAEVQKAEDKALEEKFKRMDKERAAQKKLLRELHEEQRKALQNDYSLREENLRKRQQSESKDNDRRMSDERDVLADNRKAEQKSMDESISIRKAALEVQLKDAEAKFDLESDYHAGMVATNEAQYSQGLDNMFTDLKDHMPGVQAYQDSQNALTWENIREKNQQQLNLIARDDYWEEFADRIATAIVKGTVGFDLNQNERKDFFTKGLLPQRIGEAENTANNAIWGMRPMLHSGGIAGRDHTPTGPGFVGRGQEVDATLLRGEGVLNLRAMNTPGVPDMLTALNTGRVPRTKLPQGEDGHRSSVGAGYRSSGIGAVLPSLLARVTQTATLAGLERGAAIAEQSMANVSIDLPEDQRQGLSDIQLANAASIISVGRRLGATQSDIITALMTAMQESSLINVNYGDDRHGVRNPDGSLTSSLGLFQQQSWWGSREERMDPETSAEIFFKELFKVPNRENMPMWQAAQEVQRSAFPMAYARHESLARALLGGARGLDSPVINIGKTHQQRLMDLRERLERIKEAQKGYLMPTSGLVTSLFGPRQIGNFLPDFHQGMDIANTPGTPIYAAASGIADNRWSLGGGRVISVNAEDGHRHLYLHLLRSLVKDGEYVRRGEKIALMGNTGTMTTGPHLHFEVRKNERALNPVKFFSPEPTQWSTVRAGVPAFKNGGTVPGSGFGDTSLVRAEPGEEIIRRSVAQEYRPFLKALNRGEVDLLPALSVGGGPDFRNNVDNGGSSGYNIKIEFSGPVNSEVDVVGAVKTALRQAEKSKPKKRRIGR